MARPHELSPRTMTSSTTERIFHQTITRRRLKVAKATFHAPTTRLQKLSDTASVAGMEIQFSKTEPPPCVFKFDWCCRRLRENCMNCGQQLIDRRAGHWRQSHTSGTCKNYIQPVKLALEPVQGVRMERLHWIELGHKRQSRTGVCVCVCVESDMSSPRQGRGHDTTTDLTFRSTGLNNYLLSSARCMFRLRCAK